ncbi:MAG: ABC transporter permease [Flavobacterium sp.]|nr:ABC transporter permease [Flavobacterium sp.]
MYKLWMSIRKEVQLLLRDVGGLMILFIMPLMLIITITLIQDSTFKSVNEAKIPILLVDLDNGQVSKVVRENLEQSSSFDVVTEIDNQKFDENTARDLVFKGKYQLAIIMPEKLSTDLQLKVDQNVAKITSGFGLQDSTAAEIVNIPDSKEVRIYFDPAAQATFRNAVKSAIDKMISQIETKTIYSTFQDQLGDEQITFEQESFIDFKEITPQKNNKDIIPNSTQHNVPAWTLFAIFFIVIPLSINIVKEKDQGTLVRLRTNPVSYAVVLAAKTITYLFICMLQFYLMLAVGVFLFPQMNLPQFDVDGILGLMSLVALFAGFAATGFGILLGTIAKTQEQSAPFGATAVVILAAVGGVWVPVFAMPEVMQIVAGISPMNWGLNAFYDVILRNGNLIDILPELSLLILFFGMMILISLLYDKKKRAV